MTPSPIRSPSLSSTTSPLMDADPKLDPAFGRQAGVAVDHTALHLGGTANGIDDASVLDEDAIACPLDHAFVI